MCQKCLVFEIPLVLILTLTGALSLSRIEVRSASSPRFARLRSQLLYFYIIRNPLKRVQKKLRSFRALVLELFNFLREKPSEASSKSEPRFAKARELQSMLVLEQGVSRKLSIFDTWCKNKKCLFSLKYHRKVIKKLDPTWPEPDAN